ncbi:F-box domain-containing protein [Mycena venus]|uniref:F-box domain-containing protein n=1 Tax=Mycena venus TaxID=2733690 RepID=A0A8H6Y660_9AGAR|nr:F-box domain-containing protein [Mycena venus]
MSAADLRRRLIELDVAILEQKLVLETLQRDKIAVQSDLEAISIFPVLTLPAEITTEIFTHCLPSMEELRGDRDPFIRGTLAPTALVGVCCAWRDIAFATPVLWTTLAVRFDIIDPHVLEQPGEIRSLNRLLGRLRNVIERYADRMEYLELSCSQSDVAELGLDSVAFPLLQRAAIGGAIDAESTGHIDVFFNAPELRTVQLLDGVRPSHYGFPSLQLTKFEGEINTLDLFRVASNLVEVKCAVGDLRDHDMICHAHLQSVTIQGPANNLLDSLILPALHSLHISASTEILDLESLSLLFHRSEPPVRTLSVNVYGQMYCYEWDECVSRIGGTLEELEITGPSTSFLHDLLHLGSIGDQYGPLPHLRALSLVDSPNVNYKDLVDFLRHRSTSPDLTKLQSFRFNCPAGSFRSGEVCVHDDRDEYVIGHLAAFSIDGMDICIGSGTKNYVNHIRA